MIQELRIYVNGALAAIKLRLLARVVAVLPRELVYACGCRILNEVTGRAEGPRRSFVARQVIQGEVKMLWALEAFVNAGRKRAR